MKVSKYPRFVYHSYAWSKEKEGYRIEWVFQIFETGKTRPAYTFHPYIDIPYKSFYQDDLSEAQWNLLSFHLGLIELTSYWKCVCSPQVVIESGFLDERQKSWWKKQYFRGLSEFFYVNRMEVGEEDFMDIQVASQEVQEAVDISQKSSFQLQDKVLIPIGGGKDSVVTLEVLGKYYPKSIAVLRPFIVNPRGATIACAKVGGFEMEEVAVIKRQIDPLLLQLNAEGFYNGHTPFSALLAFETLLISALCKTRYIALSNESSANESTVAGEEVNHQYSKTYSFEQDFRDYVRQYISPEFYYFSFLRPLSEIAIACLFANFAPYHSVFKSCNVGSKTDVWCAHCAKCLFAYIILAPFMNPSDLNAIFGHSLLEDWTLKKEFDELIGESPVKPFECVGTRAEVNWALQQLEDRNDALLVYYRSLKRSQDRIPDTVLTDMNPEHGLPMVLEGMLQVEFEEALKHREKNLQNH